MDQYCKWDGHKLYKVILSNGEIDMRCPKCHGLPKDQPENFKKNEQPDYKLYAEWLWGKS